MKLKKLWTPLIIFLLFLAPLIYGQTSEADEAYIKAMTAPSAAQRAQLLKEYITKYGGKGTKYENFAYANLCLLAYPGKTEKETIDYGEKALALGGLDDFTKAQVFLVLSGLYSKLGQNLDRAKNYASQAIEIGRAAKGKESATESEDTWNKIIGAGYFALGQAQEKNKEYGVAVDSYINSYNLLKDKQIIQGLKKLAKSQYDNKQYAEAEKIARAIYNLTKDIESAIFVGNCLYRSGRNEEALKFFKEAYAKKPSGEIAYNIGLILAKQAQTNPALVMEATTYLIEASLTYPSQAQQARAMAESLFFTANKELKYNEIVQQLQDLGKKLEELTKTYNSKFGNKDEEDLNETEKKEMKNLLNQIEEMKKSIDKLQAEQNLAIEKFNKLYEEIKKKLGVK
ncbi:MAG: hypothetical protein N3B16_03235 [Candidatus Aminicenantes bacterium]|nr:hypothetical protein [Candidatus Aminicenantes bacterium]